MRAALCAPQRGVQRGGAARACAHRRHGRGHRCRRQLRLRARVQPGVVAVQRRRAGQGAAVLQHEPRRRGGVHRHAVPARLHSGRRGAAGSAVPCVPAGALVTLHCGLLRHACRQAARHSGAAVRIAPRCARLQEASDAHTIQRLWRHLRDGHYIDAQSRAVHLSAVISNARHRLLVFWHLAITRERAGAFEGRARFETVQQRGGRSERLRGTQQWWAAPVHARLADTAACLCAAVAGALAMRKLAARLDARGVLAPADAADVTDTPTANRYRISAAPLTAEGSISGARLSAVSAEERAAPHGSADRAPAVLCALLALVCAAQIVLYLWSAHATLRAAEAAQPYIARLGGTAAAEGALYHNVHADARFLLPAKRGVTSGAAVAPAAPVQPCAVAATAQGGEAVETAARAKPAWQHEDDVSGRLAFHGLMVRRSDSLWLREALSAFASTMGVLARQQPALLATIWSFLHRACHARNSAACISGPL